MGGLSFPDWANGWGWRAVGARRDTLRGRGISTVIYVDAAGRRIGYSIAAGSVLPVSGGTTTELGGLRLRQLDEGGGAVVVTWVRDGHTCILATRDVDAATLLTLASYER